jgi:D-glycero-D-manno-heptose 1,7-bisphosphate phosphatase
VFLDRDGVINKSLVLNGKPFPPRSVAELQIFEEVESCVAKLERKGFEIVVVTNQPEIARGETSIKTVEEIHQTIREKTGIKNFYVCPHDDDDRCYCRKPKIGMLVEASIALNIDLQRSFLVGDRWRDIQAGQTAGCNCLFINYNYSEILPKPPYIEVRSIMQATNIITEDNK